MARFSITPRVGWLLLGLAGLSAVIAILAVLLWDLAHDHYREYGHGDVTFSLAPDGSTLAFNAAGQGGSDLYLLDLRSSHVTRLTASPDYELSPRFSPDGRSLVYAAGRPSERADHIFLRSVGGTCVRQLTFGESNDGSPDFSPDGTQIVFARDWAHRWGGLVANWDGGGSLWVMRRDGAGLHRLGPADLYAFGPRWIGRGPTLSVLYQGEKGVFTIPTDGAHPPKLVAPDGREPTASPDGRKVAFDKGEYSPDSKIYVAPLGGAPHPIASAPEGCFRPVFSPDGVSVFYLVEAWPHGYSSDPKRSLWRVRADGRDPRRLVDDALFDDPLRWRPR